MKYPVLRWIILTGLILLASCDPQMVYDQYRHVEGETWTWDDQKTFTVEVEDTVSLHNIYLQLRHTVEYPLSNLYLFVHLEGPTGNRMTDTVEMILAKPGGDWTGSGTGHLRQLSLLYRKQTRFSKPGPYRFTLEQGMRNPELPVTDLGVRIEKIKPE